MLEHVQQPAAAFAEMARLVRPGGIVYHDYNPFFSSKGGHSLCTLAFPWGHARLDAADFERYLRELRPTEVDQALRFYRESLNRMTLADLRAAVAAAGLELLALVPWFERGLVASLDPSVLPDVQRLYPTAVVDDLLATFVAVVARRPDPRISDSPTRVVNAERERPDVTVRAGDHAGRGPAPGLGERPGDPSPVVPAGSDRGGDPRAVACRAARLAIVAAAHRA